MTIIDRYLPFAVSIGFVLLVVGCGPSKSGMEAREQARDRMNLVSAQIHFDQAEQAFSTGQFEKALKEINHAIIRFSKSGEYYVLLGRIYLETHELDHSIRAFETALEIDANLADAHYYSGIVYQRWSENQASYENYQKAFELESSNVQFLVASIESLITLERFEEAEQLIVEKLAYFEHNSALRQLQGQVALLQGDAKLAAELYSQALLLAPDDDMLLEELMWSQYSAELHGQCLESVTRLQDRLSKERTDLLHLKARCLTMLDRAIEARDIYLTLTRLQPANVTLWSELGALAWELGDYKRVALSSGQLIALAPSQYEGYLLKAINERQQGNIEQAVEYFRQAADRAPTTTLPHIMLGQVCEEAGWVEEARKAYQTALAVEPQSTEARSLLSRLEKGQLSAVSPATESSP